MKNRPSLKKLHYLVALEQEQHFHRAAKSCFVSQSTLSAGIQSLEEELNCQLIERDHKTFNFTPLGHEIVTKAKRLLSEVDDLISLAENQGRPEAGTVRVGCIPTIAPFLLNHLMREVRDAYPELTLLLKEDTTSNLLDALDSGTLDLLILALPVDLRGFRSRVLGADPFHLVMHRDMQEQFTPDQEQESLPDESIFLLEKEHCLSTHAVSACQLQNRRKINPFAATSLHTLVQMVDAKLGATYLPKMAIDNGILQNTQLLAKPLNQEAYREVGIAWRQTSSRLATYGLLGEVIAKLLPLPNSD